jgi:hypothetical protein
MPADLGPNALSQRAADRLAVALEELGFDVGVAFPWLRSGTDEFGAPTVDLGSMSPTVASELAVVLSYAARYGARLPLK